MADPSEEFIERAVEPFSDNAELQLRAKALLIDQVAASSGTDEEWESFSSRLQRYDRSPVARRWQSALVAIAIVLFILVVIPSAWGLIRISTAHLYPIGGSILPSPPIFIRLAQTDEERANKLTAKLTDDERLLVVGDIKKRSLSDRWKALHDRFPESPVYFANYAWAYLHEHGDVPPDFLKTAAEIDPENAYFPYVAAAVLAKGAVKARPQSRMDKAAKKPKEWDILRPADLERALELWRAGNQLPVCKSYQSEMKRDQLAVIPPPTDLSEAITRPVMLAGASYPLELQRLSQAIAAKAENLATNQDSANFIALLGEWEISAPKLIKGSDGTLEAIISHAFLEGALPNIHDAATRLGLKEEAARTDKIGQGLTAYRATLLAARKAEGAEFLRLRGGMLSGRGMAFISGQAIAQPPVDDSQLTPARLVDHAGIGQVVAILLVSLLVIVSVLVAIYRFKDGALTKRLGSRLQHLLSSADWAWIIGGGLAPIIFFQALYYLTPLGGREWGYTLILIPASIQIGAWAVLLIITPLLMTRWRLSRRMSVFNYRVTNSRLGPLMGIIATAAVILPGVVYVTKKQTWFEAGCVCLMLAALWLAVVTLRSIFGQSSRSIGRQLLARTLIPAYAASILGLVALIPINRAQENYWVKRDLEVQGTLNSMWFDQQVAENRKSELLQIIGTRE
jgi:hypothetical protein